MTCTSQLLQIMAGSHVLWLAVASCLLTLASTEPEGKCSIFLASRVHLSDWASAEKVVLGQREERGQCKAKTLKSRVKGNKKRETGVQSLALREPRRNSAARTVGPVRYPHVQTGTSTTARVTQSCALASFPLISLHICKVRGLDVVMSLWSF